MDAKTYAPSDLARLLFLEFGLTWNSHASWAPDALPSYSVHQSSNLVTDEAHKPNNWELSGAWFKQTADEIRPRLPNESRGQTQQTSVDSLFHNVL